MSHGKILFAERSNICFDRRMETTRKYKKLRFLQLPFATMTYETYAIIRRRTSGVSHGRVMSTERSNVCFPSSLEEGWGRSGNDTKLGFFPSPIYNNNAI